MAFIKFLVTTRWLNENLKRSDVKIIDCTWIMPGTSPDLLEGFIPGAQFFDIDEVAAPHPTLKHMLPSSTRFEEAMQIMGIKPTDHVICYDRFGVRSSPRLWWTFRMFGHAKVSVLDGGLPAWIKDANAVSKTLTLPPACTTYKTSSPFIGVISQDEILSLLPSSPQIVDARPKGRFDGTVPEPRKNLKSGHIPGSLSLSFSDLIEGEALLSMSELVQKTRRAGVDLGSPIITTCGSGVTASGLALAFTLLGATDIRVYDGSWSEWGASDAPIEK